MDTTSKYQAYMTKITPRVRYHSTQPNSPLFSLPRELRDSIWEYALTETPLWYRRHAERCPVRTPSQASERPVFTTDKYKPGLPGFPDHEQLRSGVIVQCRHLCRRRRATGLLRTCKQIRIEAEPLFFKHNMFCFDSLLEFTSIMQTIPEAQVKQIQRVSVLGERSYEAPLRRRVARVQRSPHVVRRGFQQSVTGNKDNNAFDRRSGIELPPLPKLKYLEARPCLLEQELERLSTLSPTVTVKAFEFVKVPFSEDEKINFLYGRLETTLSHPQAAGEDDLDSVHAYRCDCFRCQISAFTGLVGLVPNAMMELARQQLPTYDGEDLTPTSFHVGNDQVVDVGLFALPVHHRATRELQQDMCSIMSPKRARSMCPKALADRYIPAASSINGKADSGSVDEGSDVDMKGEEIAERVN